MEKDKQMIDTVDHVQRLVTPLSQYWLTFFDDTMRNIGVTVADKVKKAKQINEYAIAWNQLTTEERAALVKQYSETWLMSRLMIGFPGRYERPGTIPSQLSDAAVFRLVEYCDLMENVSSQVEVLRANYDWEKLPENFLKLVIAHDMPQEYDIFFYAYSSGSTAESD